MGSACDQPLHGITVVVDTAGTRVYIGRYHSEDDQGVLRNDVDVRDPGTGDAKAEYLPRSAKMGVFKNTDRVHVPHAEVISIRRLLEYSE